MLGFLLDDLKVLGVGIIINSSVINIIMVWDSPLHVLGMFYYLWLIKNLLQPMAGQNKARQEIQTEIYRESRWCHGDAM